MAAVQVLAGIRMAATEAETAVTTTAMGMATTLEDNVTLNAAFQSQITA
jgi:hypothetical protein